MHHSDSATVTTVDTLAKLLDVCGELRASEQVDERAVTGCSFDSRAVSAGDVFFCKGAAFKPAFLSMALDAGAVAFVCEESLVESLEPLAKENGAAMLVVDSVRTAMALLPPEVYDRPDHDVKIVGITGTKGKTTAAFMLQSIIKAAGESSGRQSMVMEVSSQALKYQRVENLPFDVACFLNIGRDHISPIEHPTFEDYFESKLRIFDQAKTAVVNLGTDEVDRVLEAASTAERLVTVGVEHPEASLWASDVRMLGFNIEFNLHGLCADESETGEKVLLGIAGDFNVENALVAIAAAREIGIGIEAIKKGLSKLRVPGRMEVVESKDGRVICVVDYAHNQLSFRSLFSSVKRAFPASPVIALFGAAGGKAQERREQLPREAAPYSDLMIFANEDPAHEDPMKVCRELAEHVPDDTPNKIILDREAAVHAAFKAAREEYVNPDAPTIVLLLAKGDEELMHVGDEFVPIESDLSLANRLIDVTQFD